MIEEIKKLHRFEVESSVTTPQRTYTENIEVVNLKSVLEILDKYNNQPAIKSESEIYEDFCKKNGILTLKKIKDTQPDYKKILEENKALKLLLEWMVECDFGLENIMDDTIDEAKFEEETKDMSYSDSIIHYAKMYLAQEQIHHLGE
jgi:uncharacterized protein YihD (DUF1040 family)